MTTDREFDVVVFGASGFTGSLVAEYLLEHYGVGSGLRWALAGRSQAKLDGVRRSLGGDGLNLPVLLADSGDSDALEALAGRTRVVASTVGPYALHGSSLVAACAGAGTHYCDLAGEVHWMRRMIDAHHRTARRSGARIVHACGFDCIPSDLGVHWLQREMMAQYGVYCAEVKLRVVSMRGAMSGGTAASMLNLLEEAERDSSVETILKDPYALNPAGTPRGLDGPERSTPEYDPDFGAWVAPFPMAVANTKVVRRSHALLGFPYGLEFRYDEGILLPGGQLGFPLAAGLAAGSAFMTAVMSSPGARRGLKGLLPDTGTGPGRSVREGGHFHLRLLGRHPSRSSANLILNIRADRDPGYGATARMLGESAVCLARDGLASPGGVLTPAMAMGDALIDRLEENAGVIFSLED